MGRQVTLLSALIVILVTACTSTNVTPVSELRLPISSEKPSVIIFCNNTTVSCFDFDHVPENLEAAFGKNTISFSNIFVDGPNGNEWFDDLGLTELPTYLVFDTDGNEVFRTTELDFEALENHIRSILPE